MRYASDTINDYLNAYPKATTVALVGRRGCGKTYFAKDEILEHFANTGKGFIYVGRIKAHVSNQTLEDFFSDIEEEWLETFEAKYNMKQCSIRYRARVFYFHDESGNAPDVEFGKAITIKEAEDFKRTVSHGKYDRILFDEVITDEGYYRGSKEPAHLEKIVGTLARASNGGIRVYLCGNPDQNIEQCPYFTRYNLDYENMKPDSCVTFDTINANDKSIVPNNVLFIKLARRVGENGSYLNDAAMGTFSVQETRSAFDGTVKHDDYNVVTLKDFIQRNGFRPLFTLKQETAVRVSGIHPKHVYMTIGHNPKLCDGCIMVIHRHDTFDCQHVVGRYEHLGQPLDDSIYRANLELYPIFKRLYNRAVLTLNVYTEAESLAQTFFSIVKEGKQLPYITM